MVNGIINSNEFVNYYIILISMFLNVKQDLLISFIRNYYYRTNYLINAPINRIMRLANNTQVDLLNFNFIDIFIIILLIIYQYCSIVHHIYVNYSYYLT